MRTKHTRKAVRSVSPSPALRVAYRRRLLDLIRAMEQDVRNEIEAVYRENEPTITMDAAPADSLASRLGALRNRWAKNINKTAKDISEWFVNRILGDVKRGQKAAARDAGLDDLAITFTLGTVQRDTAAAIVHENVALIKSIPSQYFDRVEGSVMRSVTAGRDLQGLARDLYRDYNITKRRAAFIARDQNDKATNAIARENVEAAGVTRGVWQHIAGRKSSRETHKRMDGKIFDLKKGMWDEDAQKWVHPGELPGCRCRFKPIFDFEEVTK